MNTTKLKYRHPLTLLTHAVFLVALCLLQPTAVKAQWTTPDGSGNINNTNTGNVGIGTTTPTASLEVKKSQSAGTTVIVDNPFTTSGNSAYSGFFLKQGGVNRLLVSSVNDNHSSITPGTAQFWNFANGPTVFATNNTERMRLSAAGNLGIGTTSPGERLVTFGNFVAGNITSHTQLYSTYDSQSNMIMELGYGTATADITPLVSFVLSKNLTHTNNAIGVISFANSNIANGSEKRLISISGWTDGALNSGALVFGTTLSGTLNERLRITSGGNIGIGTATPTYKLHVQGGSVNATDGLCINGDCRGSWSQVGSQWSNNGTAINYSGGSVGIGISSPLYSLDVNGGVNGFRAKAATVSANDAIATFENSAAIKMIVRGNGNVGIGTTSPAKPLDVVGDINASGTITAGNIMAKYQDVAEWVESRQELAPGTVVIVDSVKSNQVVASTQAYDSRVAGVISLRPGLQLGEAGEGRVLVATTGRVKVKVDATNGPIQLGDLLVTSDREGYAMKSVPVDVSGVRMHRPGTLIGKALEPLAQGTGEILVLLSMQ